VSRGLPRLVAVRMRQLAVMPEHQAQVPAIDASAAFGVPAEMLGLINLKGISLVSGSVANFGNHAKLYAWLLISPLVQRIEWF
jgi:hypothetical protein